MGGKSKAPAAPDLIGLARQQAGNDQALARLNTQSNRLNEFNPFGNRTFTHKGDQWTSTTNLSPTEQKIYNQQASTGIATGKLTNRLAGSAGNMLSTPFDTQSLPARQINAGQTAQDALLSRLEPQFARDEESLRSRLANQGIAVGSDAAKAEMDQFNQGRTDARLQAGLQGMDIGERERAAAFGENSYLRNEPINQLGALRGGTQLQQPSYFSPGMQSLTQGPNLTGAASGNYQNQVGQYNANQAQGAATTNGLISAAGTAAMFF